MQDTFGSTLKCLRDPKTGMLTTRPVVLDRIAKDEWDKVFKGKVNDSDKLVNDFLRDYGSSNLVEALVVGTAKLSKTLWMVIMVSQTFHTSWRKHIILNNLRLVR